VARLLVKYDNFMTKPGCWNQKTTVKLGFCQKNNASSFLQQLDFAAWISNMLESRI
jgi:hypothetical protein